MASSSSPSSFTASIKTARNKTKKDHNNDDDNHGEMNNLRIGQGHTYDDFHYIHSAMTMTKEYLVFMMEKEQSSHYEKNCPSNCYIECVQCHGMTEEWRRRVTRWVFEVRYFSYLFIFFISRVFLVLFRCSVLRSDGRICS
mmetsp:Transcript_6075/g.7932  ORF Transcript_6075/g.7932 Transcript_6075/m.7932 type:complete len:141 (-) Transcript_6075:1379-1801(-)